MKNSMIVDRLIDKYGDEYLESYIRLNDVLYDEKLSKPIETLADLENLTKEQLALFEEEYVEYQDNMYLSEEEQEGWNDMFEKLDKD